MTRTDDIKTTEGIGGVLDKDVQNMLAFLEENNDQQQLDESNIRTLRKLREIEIKDPKSPNFMDSLQPWQIIDRLVAKLERPSSNYSSDAVDPVVSQLVRDGVKTVQRNGGFMSTLKGKPSAFKEAASYGDGYIRMGTDIDGKIVYDNAPVDKVFVDANATVLHGDNNNRKPTRMAIIYSYDHDQAQAISSVKVGLGEIPRSRSSLIDFDKTDNQDTKSEEREVESIHYFDIGGETPTNIIAWGNKLEVEIKLKAEDYPYWTNEKKPYIPNFGVMNIPSENGFRNVGYLGLLYKYILARKQLFNKHFGQVRNSLSDTNVLNVAKNTSGEVLKQMRDARNRHNKGELSYVVNDSGEEIVVTKLQAQQFEQAIELLKTAFDTEIKRLGINLDVIRPSGNVTLGQILFEAGVEDEVAQEFIDRNTDFFLDVEYRTMDMIRQNIKDNDPTPIRTNAKLPKFLLDQKGQQVINPETGLPEIETTADGQPVMEQVKGITLGTVKQLLEKFTFFVEINTKSGIKKRNFIEGIEGRSIINAAGGDPAMIKVGQKKILDALGVEAPEQAPVAPQAPGGAVKQPSAAAVEGIGKALEEQL